MRNKLNIKKYRNYYAKTKEDTDSLRDLNFLGCYHTENEKIVKKGFFNLYHGDKPSEIDFLRSQVEIAEDSQAIYEFLQNAVDANSTSFYIFWDKENFLAINNGSKFKEQDISSILNFSQSTKSNDSKNKIGKFGIGFKLIHRLVGNDNDNDNEANGLNAIINDYSGPILFSWDNYYIKSLLNKNLDAIDEHWLFKILYTNFPCGLEEKVKNKQYEEKILFSNYHLEGMVNFIEKQNIDLEMLSEGSLFFLKLGDNKSKLLDSEKESIQHGIKYSLNIIEEFTKKKSTTLNHININNIQVDAEDLDCINTDTCTMLFSKNLEQATNYYHRSPTEKISFFKFFPMGDQNNGLNFIIHSNRFHIESNRRKLHKENKNILEKISSDLQEKFNTLKENSLTRFENVLANLYLSDLNTANNDKLICDNFSMYFIKYIKDNIPYVSVNTNGVKVLKTTRDKTKVVVVDSLLHDIPLQDYSHFYFNPKKNKDIVKEAVNKLGLKRWSIIDVLINDNINDWVLSLSDSRFNKILLEIEGRNKYDSQNIVNIWRDSYGFNEIKRILQIFNVLDKNIKFAVFKSEINNYGIVSSSNNHFIENNSFKEFLEINYEMHEVEYYLIPKELENEITRITGKKTFDTKILQYLLKEKQHQIIVDFIEVYKFEEIFLDTLSRLDIETSAEYGEMIYALKVLNFILKNEGNVEVNKRKIFIDNEQMSQLFKSQYITFKYQSENSSKVINPKSYNSDEKRSKQILSFIEKLDSKYASIFNIQEESKSIVFEGIKNDILSNNRLNNKINTKNRLKFILLYSLEEGCNFIKGFSGIDIYNHEGKTDESIFRLYKILKDDVKIKDDRQLDIFNISDFLPQILNKEYYIEDNSLSVEGEKLPSDIDVNYIELFKKIGLVINLNLPIVRKKLLEKVDISLDDFKKLNSKQLTNTCKFIQEKNIKFNLDSDDTKNIEKLFKMFDGNEKIELGYYPSLKTKSSLIFKRINKYDKKYYIFKDELKSENKAFQKRLTQEIGNKNIIYIEVLDFDEIPSSWISIKENAEEKNKGAMELVKQEKMTIDKQLSKTSDYSNHTAEIGRKGELLVKELLISKFGIDRVIDNNELGEKNKIDFEILDENLVKIIHKVEVKSTIKEVNKNNDVAFYMSSEQYKYAQKYDNNTHLIFVTGVEDDKPEFLYMNFNNSWLKGLARTSILVAK